MIADCICSKLSHGKFSPRRVSFMNPQKQITEKTNRIKMLFLAYCIGTGIPKLLFSIVHKVSIMFLPEVTQRQTC